MAHLKKHYKSHAADGVGSGSGDGGEKSAPTAAGSDSSGSATNAGGLMSNSTSDHQQDSSASMVTTFYHANSHNNHHHLHHRHHSLSMLENEGKENEKEVKEHQQQLIYQQHQLLLLQQQEQLQLQIQLQQQQQQLQQEEFKQDMSPEKEVVVQPKEMRQPRKQLLQKRKDPEDGGEEGSSKVVKGELMEKKKRKKVEKEEEVIVKNEIGEECEVFNFVEEAYEDQQIKEEFVDEGDACSTSSPKKMATSSVPDAPSPNIETTVDNQQASNTLGVSSHEETAVIVQSDTPISIINTTTPSSQQSPFTLSTSSPAPGPPLTSNVSGSLFTVSRSETSLSPEDDFKVTLDGDGHSLALSSELSSSSVAPSPSPQRPLQLNLPFNLLNSTSNIYLVYNCPRCTTVFFTEEAALLHQANCVGGTLKDDMASSAASSIVTSSLASTSFSQALEGPSVIKPSLMLVDPSILGQHAVGGDNGGINGSGL